MENITSHHSNKHFIKKRTLKELPFHHFPLFQMQATLLCELLVYINEVRKENDVPRSWFLLDVVKFMDVADSNMSSSLKISNILLVLTKWAIKRKGKFSIFFFPTNLWSSKTTHFLRVFLRPAIFFRARVFSLSSYFLWLQICLRR